MLHYFDAELARRYGMLEAVLINHLQFWIERNRQNGLHVIDGCCWTYNTVRDFSGALPYASEKQIRSALKHLIDGGIVKTGRFNRYGFDRTLWYTFTDFGRSILPQGQTEAPERADGNDREGKTETPGGANGAAPRGKPIPRNDPDNDPHKDPAHHTGNERARTGRRFAPPTREEVAAYCRERNNGVDARRFVDYYTANGWRVGKNPMRDWRAAVRTWEKGETARPARPRDDTLDGIL